MKIFGFEISVKKVESPMPEKVTAENSEEAKAQIKAEQKKGIPGWGKALIAAGLAGGAAFGLSKLLGNKNEDEADADDYTVEDADSDEEEETDDNNEEEETEE